MCPLCWGAAAALYAAGAGVPAVLAAWRDFAVWVLAIMLVGTGVIHRWGEMDVFLPWWWYLSLGIVLYTRVAFLIVVSWQQKKRFNAAERIRAVVGQ